MKMNLIVITNKLQIKSMIAKLSGIGAKLKIKSKRVWPGPTNRLILMSIRAD